MQYFYSPYVASQTEVSFLLTTKWRVERHLLGRAALVLVLTRLLTPLCPPGLFDTKVPETNNFKSLPLHNPHVPLVLSMRQMPECPHGQGESSIAVSAHEPQLP